MNISLQLWSLKEEAAADFAHALELSAQAGYQGVEFAGYYGNSPEQLKELLAKYGLEPVSTHAGISRLREVLDEELTYAKKLGCRMIVCPWSDCASEAEIVEDARFLESCAQKAAKEGVLIGYHNHDQEFRRFGGKFAMDILLENMPSVRFEPDVFWIAYADVDPVQYIAPLAAAGRICAVHAKEIAKEGKENVYIGQGRIDFAGIAALCPPSQYPYIVEQEEFSGGHFDGIAKSYQGLKKILDRSVAA
ncbi:MAG: sugar phosphate isomerase/epimerase [Spirochaetaceae bacterium]|jgi:sugar phosphate isomerase/epimerase|nr:sugar phosphate isomerase/epimerase [Spirochaetaceae bacterium]